MGLVKEALALCEGAPTSVEIVYVSFFFFVFKILCKKWKRQKAIMPCSPIRAGVEGLNSRSTFCLSWLCITWGHEPDLEKGVQPSTAYFYCNYKFYRVSTLNPLYKLLILFSFFYISLFMLQHCVKSVNFFSNFWFVFFNFDLFSNQPQLKVWLFFNFGLLEDSIGDLSVFNSFWAHFV